MIILPTVVPVTKFTVVEESALARLAAIGTGATVGGGGSAMAMKNAKGVVIDIFTTTAWLLLGPGSFPQSEGEGAFFTVGQGDQNNKIYE